MSSSGSLEFSPRNDHASSLQRAAQVRYFVIGLLLLLLIGLAWPILGRGLSNFEFMPHSFCYLGNTTLITTNLVSDLLIGISYVVISLTLVYLVRASRGGIPFHWMFLAFGTFIIACGGTHFMEAVTLWHPIYWASAYVKVVTALASVATAVALPLAMPHILKNVEAVQRVQVRELELVKANAELSAANEKLQELDRLRRRFVAQTAANVGDWDWDIPAGTVHWSEEMEAIHGLAPRSFPGTFAKWIEAMHPDDRHRAISAAMAAIENKSDYDTEYRTPRPDGSVYWTAARGTVKCSSSGEPVRMVGMCMDITSRKRTEETLRKTEKLAAAGRLAATIAHEINNPLEAVANLLFLAKADASPESRAQLLEMADRELQRVGHITRQTLGFYRDSSKPVMLEISEVWNNLAGIFQARLASRNIKLAIDSPRPIHLYSVPGELKQVLSNLLSNAIDASPPQSQIRIRMKEKASAVQITIADQGCGITRESGYQVFEPFFTTKKDVGTGLGLWITKQIVDHHGGTIRFRSAVAPGRSGTVFFVNLLKRPATNMQPAVPHESVQLR